MTDKREYAIFRTATDQQVTDWFPDNVATVQQAIKLKIVKFDRYNWPHLITGYDMRNRLFDDSTKAQEIRELKEYIEKIEIDIKALFSRYEAKKHRWEKLKARLANLEGE